jgi:hypothetical protein
MATIILHWLIDRYSKEVRQLAMAWSFHDHVSAIRDCIGSLRITGLYLTAIQMVAGLWQRLAGP